MNETRHRVRVLIVDDHPVVRAGLRNVLAGQEDIIVVGEAQDGIEGVALAASLRPDVILLDMEMPGMHGVEVVQHIKDQGLTCRILVLSAHDDSEYIQQLFIAGVAGYLLKEEAPTMITEAIRGAAQGEDGWVSRKVTAAMSSVLQSNGKGKYGLTPREQQVLRALADGRTNQEIGFAMSVSEKTIEKHIFSILNKMKVSSRVEAAVLAVRENLV